MLTVPNYYKMCPIVRNDKLWKSMSYPKYDDKDDNDDRWSISRILSLLLEKFAFMEHNIYSG